jgi:hypothetical protein
MEKTMAVEIQENRVRIAPLIFTVPACGLVVAARTRQFQHRQSTSEELHCPGTRQPAAGFRREINPEQSPRELRPKTASLKSGKVELLVFLFFGFVALVATACSFAELFHLPGNGVPEQTIRALLTK